MAETILSRAIRGLGSSLRFTGSRSGPPGVDLSRASTPVNDLTQYARYGSAIMFSQLQDGWFTATFDQNTTESGFTTQTELWDTQVSGDFGIAINSLAGMMCWIYSVSQFAVASAALSDIGGSRVLVDLARGIGGGLNSVHTIWLNDGATGPNVVLVQNNQVELVNMARPFWPFPWAPGAQMAMRVRQVNANPVTVTRRWTFLCRLLPFGVPPLP